MLWAHPVESIESQKYGVKCVAPGHRLLAGARIRFSEVRGLPEELAGESFIVDDCVERDSFNICRDVREVISIIHAAEGVVETARPHGLPSFATIQIEDVEGEGAQEVEGKRYTVCERQACRIVLAVGKEIAPGAGIYQGWDRVRLPEGLRGGCVVARRSRVCFLHKYFAGWGGQIELVPIHRSRAECVADWTAALAACRSAAVPSANVEPLVFQDPKADGMEVVVYDSFCGGGGIYKRQASNAYVHGCAQVAYVDELSLWCFMADVQPCGEILANRKILGLETNWEGPQLLYVCRGNPTTGGWEPVLGEYPAPEVRVASGPRRETLANYTKWPQTFETQLLDMLFPVPVSRDRASALDLARYLNAARFGSLLADLCAASRTCASWRQTLESARQVYYIDRALNWPDRLCLQLPRPTLRDAVFFLGFNFAFHTALISDRPHSWDAIDPRFSKCVWACSVDEMSISAETQEQDRYPRKSKQSLLLEQLAPGFVAWGRDVFCDLQLPWNRHFRADGFSTHGDVHRAVCSLLGFRSCKYSLMWQDDPGNLFWPSGERVQLFSPQAVALLGKHLACCKEVPHINVGASRILNYYAISCNEMRGYISEDCVSGCTRGSPLKQLCEKCRAVNDHVRCRAKVLLECTMDVVDGPVDSVTFTLSLVLTPLRSWHRDTLVNKRALTQELAGNKITAMSFTESAEEDEEDDEEEGEEGEEEDAQDDEET
eukprot:TRINITY_DN64259_c0_g1_i1.p1 TRINITY_DN64259_c0_g1~~TRINITY_DN64259_c0_g1_i1.p1  ORF type:complete len:719 (+),score=71.80 TRINITY_DN64259_c0_g1_i1:83-2239(+)